MFIHFVYTTLVLGHLMNSFDVDPKTEKAIFIRNSKELKFCR